jgi:ABC-type transport system substrate-binding protein
MKILQIVLLASLLLFSLLLPCVLAAPPPIQRQMEIIEATIEGGSIATVDPAAAYDTASGAILLNSYDTLVFFDGEHLDKYLPQLATEWSIVRNKDQCQYWVRILLHVLFQDQNRRSMAERVIWHRDT